MKLNRTLKNSSIFCFKSLTLAARRVGNDDAERQGERFWLSLVLDTRGSTSNYNPARCSTDSPKVARLLQKKKKNHKTALPVPAPVWSTKFGKPCCQSVTAGPLVVSHLSSDPKSPKETSTFLLSEMHREEDKKKRNNNIIIERGARKDTWELSSVHSETEVWSMIWAVPLKQDNHMWASSPSPPRSESEWIQCSLHTPAHRNNARFHSCFFRYKSSMIFPLIPFLSYVYLYSFAVTEASSCQLSIVQSLPSPVGDVTFEAPSTKLTAQTVSCNGLINMNEIDAPEISSICPCQTPC